MNTGRPTLDQWLNEYAAIEQEWICALEQHGIEFEPRNAHATEVAALKERLREQGARFLNGGASISVGPISSACEACVGDQGSKTFFLSLACNRNCYFCFNQNQENYEQHLRVNPLWEAEVDDYLHAPVAPTHAALTGGEPLLHKQETEQFFEHIHNQAPDVHLRLYTAGDFLDEETLEGLQQAGLREIRLSVKFGDGESDDETELANALERIKLAKRYIPDVMVELPVIPGTESSVRRLMQGMEQLGAFGINLLEFCYPYGDWNEYAKRGFEIKNPPFSVLYDYGYAGGLPVAGSELACLSLVQFALDSQMNLGVHYCSLDNKNRDQILQANLRCPFDKRFYELDSGDCFLKTLKVFDQDVAPARKLLQQANKPYFEDEDDYCLITHPRNASLLGGLVCALSFNVGECDSSVGWTVRELKLEVI